MKRTIPAIAVFILLISPAGRSAVAPDPPSGFLHTQGGLVLDGQGRTIVLRGINMDNFYYFYPDLPPSYGTREDILRLADLGANVIRLGFHWS